MEAEQRTLTPAERHYEALKKAQRDYWRRKHPNPRPVGRPRKAPVQQNPDSEGAVKV